MILIIDSYFVPAERISRFLYKKKAECFRGVEELSNDRIWYVHCEHLKYPDMIKRYFDETVEVVGHRLVVTNKKKRKVTEFLISDGGFIELVGDRKIKLTNRAKFAPYAEVCNGDVVYFPDEEDCSE